MTAPRPAIAVLLAAALLVLAACGAQPAPRMAGAARREVTVEGRRYVVFFTGSRVEVIRLGRARSGEHQAIRAAMIDLIGPVTGCRLIEGTLEGDSGEMRGRIAC